MQKMSSLYTTLGTQEVFDKEKIWMHRLGEKILHL